jgi:hypothetical protein
MKLRMLAALPFTALAALFAVALYRSITGAPDFSLISVFFGMLFLVGALVALWVGRNLRAQLIAFGIAIILVTLVDVFASALKPHAINDADYWRLLRVQLVIESEGCTAEVLDELSARSGLSLSLAGRSVEVKLDSLRPATTYIDMNQLAVVRQIPPRALSRWLAATFYNEAGIRTFVECPSVSLDAPR